MESPLQKADIPDCGKIDSMVMHMKQDITHAFSKKRKVLEFIGIEDVRDEMDEVEKRCKKMAMQLAAVRCENSYLKSKNTKLKSQITNLELGNDEIMAEVRKVQKLEFE